MESREAATCSEVMALRRSPRLTWAIASAASSSRLMPSEAATEVTISRIWSSASGRKRNTAQRDWMGSMTFDE